MYQYQYKQAMCEYKYQKKIRCDGKQLPEFQGQLAQQLVGVSGVVLVLNSVKYEPPPKSLLKLKTWRPRK